MKKQYRLYFSGTEYEYWAYPTKFDAVNQAVKLFKRYKKDKIKSTVKLVEVTYKTLGKYKNYK